MSGPGRAGMGRDGPRRAEARRVGSGSRLTWSFAGAQLWTGIQKGPPRKLKFPEPQAVVEELEKHLS